MDGLISGVASNALTSLGSSALQEVAAAWHFKSELDGLTETISFIRGVLLAREGHRQPHDLDVLIERLKDAVHDADDLIDEVTTLVERKKLMMTGRGRFTKEFRLFFSRENQVGTAFKISREIKRIRKTLDKIVADRVQFAPMLPSNEPSSPVIERERETYSFVRAENVIGRDDEKQKILHLLLRHGQGSHTVVLGIYGSGGLGKTTIAQLVFNDEVVQGHFELKLWVCVGDFMRKEFDIKLIIRKIIMSATGSSCSDDLGLEQLHTKLREKMGGKKYFLVLDDLWEENPAKLDKLKEVLAVGGKGSAVLVTTRFMVTARSIGTILPVKLQCLSDDASWTLFKKMTELEQNDQRLVQIGKEIVKKCGNLPLAIKVIGSLLRGKDETEWQRFEERDLASIAASSNIMPLLKLSYYRLRPQLKHCFTYCSLFPKDYPLKKKELCYLWIAQGFITSSSHPNERILEDEAEHCFLELLDRCFFQDVDRNELGEIQTFKMHDLIHDLAKEVAGKEIHIADDNGDQNHLPSGVRHLSFRKFSSVQNLISSMQGQNHLRTLLDVFLPLTGSDVMNDIINSFQCVRALDLGNSGIEQLPESIGKLIHLRYLKLVGNRFEVLPKSITRLHNLETLDLDRCSALKELPWDLSKLVNLQNLGVRDCEKLACMPARMGGLTRLQRLNRFVVGEEPASTDHAYTRCCNSKRHIINASGLHDLIPLKYLRGSLEIDISRKVRSDSMAIITKATAGCLRNKTKLTDLSIRFYYLEGADASRDEGLLEWLQPHCHIKGIELTNYGGTKFPSWMSMDNLAIALPKLVKIKLWYCSSCLNLPILSRLLYLKTASLGKLPRLEYIESQSYEASALKSVEFFPSLQELTLDGLSNVKGWWMPTGDGTDLECDQHVAHPSLPPFFPRLASLRIDNCPKMTSMPLCPHLKELRLCNFNENLHIIPEKEEYSILAASLGPSATSTSTSISSSSSTPNCCPSTHRLRILQIGSIKSGYYGGMRFPSWMPMDNLAIALPNLVEIKLQDCLRCLNLPILSKLPCLKIAHLWRLPRLEYIESQSYEASTSKSVEFFPSLQELTLRGLSNVKGWWMPTGDGTDLECDQHVAHPSLTPYFPCLNSLCIFNCPKMTSMPPCPHLKKLRLQQFNENLHIIPEIEEYSILAASLGPSARSTSTSISSSSSAPNCCPSTHLLRSLEIDSISYLNHLPKQHLQSLIELYINSCKDVALSAAHDEEEGQMACKSLERLPKGLEYLTNLKRLSFLNCDNLVELTGWISQLSSLKSLVIERCKKLKSLPDGIRDLTSLRLFILDSCDEDLTKRCEKLTGEDWHKIQHVPNIHIW